MEGEWRLTRTAYKHWRVTNGQWIDVSVLAQDTLICLYISHSSTHNPGTATHSEYTKASSSPSMPQDIIPSIYYRRITLYEKGARVEEERVSYVFCVR